MAKEVGLGQYVRDGYWIPLSYAHPSPHAILSLISDKDGSLTIEPQPRREEARISFYLAYFFVLKTLELHIEHFSLTDLSGLLQICISDFAYYSEGKQPPS
jgi:hypothetical protein